MKLIRIFFVICICIIFTTCLQSPRSVIIVEQEPDPTPPINPPVVPPSEIIPRKWTFVLYMAGDNDLEREAIYNLNQLEGVDYTGSGITVLVLIDRAAGFDHTNGDWTDTRLYEVVTDKDGVDNIIDSKRLQCPELGLKEDTQTELNMSDYRTLHNTLTFAKKYYQADNYGLIVWGHGSGWRTAQTQSRAIAFDDTSGSFMTNPELRQAVTGMGLSFIGFDTCFGALMEIAYELKGEANRLIGSPGLSPAIGWDYFGLFSQFITSAKNRDDFETAVVTQYSKTCRIVPNSAIAVIDLTKISGLRTTLDSFARELADSVTDSLKRKTVLDLLISGTESYSYTSYPADYFVDTYDMAAKVHQNASVIASSSSKAAILSESATNLQNALHLSIPKGWKHGKTTAYPLSIHLIPFTAAGVPSAKHDNAYIKGNTVLYQDMFINDSTGWIPNKIPSSSLLDKLFYTTF